MLYKVTPAMEPPRRKKAESGEGTRKRRKTAVYDADGNEVLISLMCLKCRTVRPLAQFGLRKMSDGAIRNQPWCRGCRGAVTKKEPASAKKETPAQEAVVTPAAAPAVAAVAAPVVAATTVAATTVAATTVAATTVAATVVAAAPAPVALNDVASVVAETVAPAGVETVALPAASIADPAPALIAAEPPARLEVEVEDSPEREREVFAAVEESAAY
jgi:hypothetical protein